MAVGWRIRMPAFLLALALSMAAAPAGAQTGDIAAIQKSYNQLFAAGDYAAALVEAQKLEALAKQRFGTEHAVYATALHNLAVVYKEQNELAESETRHKRALAIREKLFGASHPEVAKSLNELADLYADHARYAEAEHLPNAHWQSASRRWARGTPTWLRRSPISRTFTRHQGRYGDAEAAAKRALAI